MRTTRKWSGNFILTAAILSASFAQASNVPWINPGGGSYSTPSNWADSGLIPGSADTPTFNLASSAGYTVTLTASPTNSQLSVGNDKVILDLNGQSYALTSFGYTAGNHSLEVGNPLGGSLTLQNSSAQSATLSGNYASIGDNSGDAGSVTVAGAKTSLSLAQSFNVGDSGNGTLVIQNGGSVTDSSGSIGQGVGSTGSATVNGAGSTWNSNNYFYVGYWGTGSLTIQNGGKVLNGVTYIGRNAAGNATITDPGSNWNTTYFDVGYYAAGTVNILNGASVSDVDSVVSCSATAPGTVTINGANSTWTTSDSLTVGSVTTGIVNILNGTVSVARTLAISNHPGSQINLSGGTLNVGFLNTSSNPSLFLGNGLTTGWTGGTLNITQSGLPISSSGPLGANLTLGAGKTLEVSGSGQTLSIAAGASLNVAGGSVYANTLANAGALSLPRASSVEAANALVNTGLIDISGGTLQLDAGVSGTSVRSQIQIGYDGGKWDGTNGITSTFANGHVGTALGYITTGGVTKVFTTWDGDANGDGVVNNADLASISSAGTTWQTGDFNYDGLVNSDDWSLFFLGSLYGSSNISTLLPEPMGLTMLLPIAGLCRRRRR